MFIVSLEYGVSLEAVDALMPAHVAWLRRHYKSGLFIASGRKKPRTGGVILARSGNRKQLEEALARDPFIAKGAATFELIEFQPSMTAPGAEALKVL
jgi:uncharacterized protein YciI